jgi:transposase
MDAIYVGIDVSKDRLDAAVSPGGESFAVSRTGAGIDELIERLKPLSIKLVAIEATGGFETVVAAGLAGAALPVVVVNPAQVRAFAQALGKRAKTDPIDAAVIAHFAEAIKPQLRKLPDATTQLLADLVARRRQIVEMIAAESQRASHVTLPRLKKSIARLHKALEKELSELDNDISDHVRARSNPRPYRDHSPDYRPRRVEVFFTGLRPMCISVWRKPISSTDALLPSPRKARSAKSRTSASCSSPAHDLAASKSP